MKLPSVNLRAVKLPGMELPGMLRLRALVTRASHRIGSPGRVVAASAVLAVAGACGIIVMVGTGNAENLPLAGVAVPPTELTAVQEAAGACTTMTAPRIAAQVMEASGFSGTGANSRGGTGIAGLTATAWKDWAPWPGAVVTDSRASILGLSHYMCDLIGQLRIVGISGDQWRLALAAYASGMNAVVTARAVPAEAQTYVDTVASYAAWYTAQAQFGGSGQPSLTTSPNLAALTAPATAVPDAFVAPVMAAGTLCPQVTPSRIAAQLMAMSGFNANKLGATGAQGIAQFQPVLWSQYAPDATSTPWDAAAAIPALGRAMCDLTQQMTVFSGPDPYLLALAAYLYGADTVKAVGGDATALPLQRFLGQLVSYIDYYLKDTRLALPGTTPPPQPSMPPSSRATTPPSTPRPNPTSPPKTTTPKPSVTTTAPGTPAAKGLVSDDSGKCLSSTAGKDGTQLQIWTCDGSTPQQWTFASDGTIRSMGLCMDAAGAGTANGNSVQVARCSGNPAQRFTLKSNGYLYSDFAGRCVDVRDFGTSNGTVVQLWDCSDSANQLWRLR